MSVSFEQISTKDLLKADNMGTSWSMVSQDTQANAQADEANQAGRFATNTATSTILVGADTVELWGRSTERSATLTADNTSSTGTTCIKGMGWCPAF